MEKPARERAGAPALTRVLDSRRHRSFIGFRRKSDALQFILCLVMLGIGGVSLTYSIARLKGSRLNFRVVEPLSAAVAPPAVAATALAPPDTPHISAPAPVSVPPPPPPTTTLALLSQNIAVDAEVYKNAQLVIRRGRTEDGPWLRLNYTVQPQEWVQATIAPVESVAKFGHLRFQFTGEGEQRIVEFTATDRDGTTVGGAWQRKPGNWTSVDVSLTELAYRFGGNRKMDWSHVEKVAYSVSVRPGQKGGTGWTAVRAVEFY